MDSFASGVIDIDDVGEAEHLIGLIYFVCVFFLFDITKELYEQNAVHIFGTILLVHYQSIHIHSQQLSSINVIPLIWQITSKWTKCIRNSKKKKSSHTLSDDDSSYINASLNAR